MSLHAVINDQSGHITNIIEWDGLAPWTPPQGHSVRPALPTESHWEPPLPSDDEQLAARGTRQRYSPTFAAGKGPLRDILDGQVREAQAWDWFNTKVQADAQPSAAFKVAVDALAEAEYDETKRLIAAWRQAV